jgi:carbon-monoxide dehydrogenase small subunit
MASVVELHVNGAAIRTVVDDRLLLSDFLRDTLALKSVHVGCDLGSCGACAVHLDGHMELSCLSLAIQCDGRSITTLEGLQSDAEINRLRGRLAAHHALQCGFCTPGVIAAALEMARGGKSLSREEIRAALNGNLCRCTGYFNIVNAIEDWLKGRGHDV